MMTNPTLSDVAALLLQQDKIAVISHRAPDGDTLGSAMALCRALRQAGKQVDFLCSDSIPAKYHYLFEGMEQLLEQKGLYYETYQLHYDSDPPASGSESAKHGGCSAAGF